MIKNITAFLFLCILISCKEEGRKLPYYDTADYTPKWEIPDKNNFHSIRNFMLVDQEGKTFTEKDLDGKITGWRPWHYEKERLVQKAVNIVKDSKGMQSWTAECFFPYALLQPLQATPPKKGTVWNANFCRLDYDAGHMVKWSWSPIKVTFHEFKAFKSIRFQ